MEADVFEVLLSHLEHEVALGQKDVSSILILGQILDLSLFEFIEFGLVVALDPACFVEGEAFVAAFGSILVEEAVFDDLELEGSHGTDDFATIELMDK